MHDFTIAVGQWPVLPEKRENLDRAASFLREAAERGASLCLLPEMFQTPYDLEAMEAGAEEATGPTLGLVRSLAAELSLTVVAGSFCERVGGRLYNSCFVLGPDGAVLGAHRKIHLFDVRLETVRMEESRILSAGDRPLVVDLPFCRLGVAICYDLRFPEVFRDFEARGAEVIALPAAFSRTTGEAHWHVLLRSRAVDYQVYVAAASPAPSPGSAYVAYGHSLVADPWGTVLAEAGEGTETIFAALSAPRLARVRAELPLLAHRRPDLYRTWRSPPSRSRT